MEVDANSLTVKLDELCNVSVRFLHYSHYRHYSPIGILVLSGWDCYENEAFCRPMFSNTPPPPSGMQGYPTALSESLLNEI